MNTCIVEHGVGEIHWVKPSLPVSEYTHNLASTLTDSGHLVYIISRPGEANQDMSYYFLEASKRYLPRSWPFAKNLNEVYYGLKVAFLLRKLHRKEKFDAILFDSYTAAFFSRIFFEKEKLILLNTGPLPNFPNFSLWSFLNFLLQNFVHKKCCKAIVTNGGNLRDEVIRYFKLSQEKVKSINDAVDVTLFCPVSEVEQKELRKNLNLAADCPLILSVGGITPRKNQLSLIKAIPEIHLKFPQARFIFIGPIADKKYYAKIRDFVKFNALEEKVAFTGFIENPEELLPYYQACDVFVLLSLKEGLPKVVLNAMSCGKALVLSNIPPHYEAAGEEGAIFVEAFNTSAISLAVIRLLENPSLRQEIGKKAREIVEKKFTWQAVAQRYNEIVHEI